MAYPDMNMSMWMEEMERPDMVMELSAKMPVQSPSHKMESPTSPKEELRIMTLL